MLCMKEAYKNILKIKKRQSQHLHSIINYENLKKKLVYIKIRKNFLN